MTEDDRLLHKWRNYYINPSARPPWETSSPSSFVLALLPSLPKGSRTLELGCGLGLTSIHLVHACECRATAVDLVPEAVAQGRAKERELYPPEREEGVEGGRIEGSRGDDDRSAFTSEGGRVGGGVEWLVGDLFTLLASPRHKGQYDLIIDIQCLHTFPSSLPPFPSSSPSPSPPRTRLALARLTHSLLKPGGRALIVVGNDKEKYGGQQGKIGPSLLSKEEVMEFCREGGLEEGGDEGEGLREGRFERTEAYGEHPPWCWVGVFRRKEDKK